MKVTRDLTKTTEELKTDVKQVQNEAKQMKDEIPELVRQQASQAKQIDGNYPLSQSERESCKPSQLNQNSVFHFSLPCSKRPYVVLRCHLGLSVHRVVRLSPTPK